MALACGAQLSVAVGLKLTTAPHRVAGAPTVRLARALNTGYSVSFTVTVWVAVAVLPAASVAVHVTVVVPFGKVEGALLITATPAQLSPAVAVPRATLVAEH